MTANKTRPVQATAPKRIYLQGGPQLPKNIDFSSLSEVTWCRDDVDGTGIPYVRADLAGAAPAAVAGPAPAGWRLVPAVPTRDWTAALADDGYEDCNCAQMIASILSHAPAAPALEAPAAPTQDMESEQCRCEPSDWSPPAGYDGDGSVAALARAALAAAPQAPAAPWKDHLTARLVNDLRDCAIKYHGAGQLRDRIAHIVAPLCDQLKAAQAAPAAPAVDALAHAETLKKAARYDWLRDFHEDGIKDELPYIAAGTNNEDAWALSGDDADAFIDAAIAAQAKEGGAA